MPKTYHRSITRTTEENRKQLCFDYFINFMTVRKVCQRYRLADKTVRDIIERFRRTNSVEYRLRGGLRNIKIKDEHYTFLRNTIDKEDEGNILTLEQLKQRLTAKIFKDFSSANSIGYQPCKSTLIKSFI